MHGKIAVGSREDNAHANEARSTITSTTGGVMMKEVDVATGDPEVVTRHRAGGIEVAARYAGAVE